MGKAVPDACRRLIEPGKGHADQQTEHRSDHPYTLIGEKKNDQANKDKGQASIFRLLLDVYFVDHCVTLVREVSKRLDSQASYFCSANSTVKHEECKITAKLLVVKFHNHVEVCNGSFKLHINCS